MSRFFVLGSLGINAGDDAMNIALVSMLQQRGCQVGVASINPSFTQVLLGSSVPTISSSYLGLVDWISHLRRADAVLIGGGTMIQPDPASRIVSGITLKACAFAFLARALGMPVYCVGIGVSSVSRAADRLLSRWLLRLSARVYVRDADSAERAIRLSQAAMAKVAVMPDLAFGLTAGQHQNSSLSSGGAAVSKAPEQRVPPQAGAVFISAVGEQHKAASSALIKTVSELALRRGLPVVLVAMDRRDTEELGLYNQFRAGLSPAIQSQVQIRVVEDPRELLRELRGSRVAIGMRLHFCILSLVAGVMPIVVSREEKTDSLAEAEGLTRVVVDDLDFVNAINAAVSARIDGSDMPLERASVARYARQVEAVVGELTRRTNT